MMLAKSIGLNRFCHFSFWLLFMVVPLFSQSTNLSVRFVNTPPAQVPVGDVFAIQAVVEHSDANSLPVTGEDVVATLELINPLGVSIFSYVQTWSGFANPQQNNTLDNDQSNARQVLIQVPWSESRNWVVSMGPDFQPYTNDDIPWRITLRVSSPSMESDLSDNQTSHSFSIQVPDLEVGDLVVQAREPLTGALTQITDNNPARPGDRLEISGNITNGGQVMTQPGIRFPVEARLFADDPGNIISRNLSIDFERIVLPVSDGSTEPSVLEGAIVPFVISNLQVPEDADGTYSIQVLVDSPEDLGLVEEFDDINNNHQLQTITVDPNAGAADLEVIASSFSGETGIFRGLDPVRIAFSIRNIGDASVSAEENSSAQVILSTDDSFDDEDFILREFDLGGAGLGAGLQINETINLDWVQQLPDNFEGDYYLLVNLIEGDASELTPLRNSPVYTLTTENQGTTEMISQNDRKTERPQADRTGRFLVFEQADVGGIMQIFLQDLSTDDPAVLVSRSIDNGNVGGNENSYRPRISADGSTVVFHSKASNLVVADQNFHEDVFLYRVDEDELIRAEGPDGLQPNEGSFYPDINQDGSLVVFESDATNLNFDGNQTTGRQVFLWDLRDRLEPKVHSLTNGNLQSYHAKIDDAGEKVVFASSATNLIADDTNGYTDIFLATLDADKQVDQIYRANIPALNTLNDQAEGGLSDQPEISGDGSTIVFRSKATNMISFKGVSNFKLSTSGSGYFGSPTIVVTDAQNTGSGAKIELSSALDIYGQFLADGIRISAPGINYTNPVATVIPDPTFAPPNQLAVIDLYLYHPDGEVYKISSSDVMGTGPVFANYSVRVSENEFEVGGNMPSQDPSINETGDLIVYATKSSNLLDDEVQRSDGRIFQNDLTAFATAKAILVGGIGEIEIIDEGVGYQNGFFSIVDDSGTGQGAVVSYEVDSAGRISAIHVIDPGTNYNLETTSVTVQNPDGGTGFIAGQLRFAETFGTGNNRRGGGRIFRVEMVENGSGYDQDVYDSLEQVISIEGDGLDYDLDGYADAKLNDDLVHIDEQGGIYLEQKYEVELLSTTNLPGSSLIVEDANKSIEFLFDFSAAGAITIDTTSKTLSEISSEIVTKISQQWNVPSSVKEGPVTVYNTGGTKFSLSALSGRVSTDSFSSIRITPHSNLLFSGDGFTRATPIVVPSPFVHGFSETGIESFDNPIAGGRISTLLQPDFDTEDIYLFKGDTNKTERVSLSTFGYPVNYRPSEITTMPSNRFPSISGDGRHVFFSSDASDEAGLVFDGSNQNASDNDATRDVYHRDRQTQENLTIKEDITILNQNQIQSQVLFEGGDLFVVMQVDAPEQLISEVRLFVNGKPEAMGTNLVKNLYQANWQPRFDGTYEVQLFAEDASQNIIAKSDVFEVQVLPTEIWSGGLPNVSLLSPFANDFLTTKSSIYLSATASDPDFDLKEVQFFVDGQPFGDPIQTPVSGYADRYPYLIRWEPQSVGLHYISVMATDHFGHTQYSGSNAVRVTEGTELPPRPEFKGVVQVAEVQVDFDESEVGKLKFTLKNNGLGYESPPKVVIDNFGTGGSGANFDFLQSDIDEVSGKILQINNTSGGSGYTSLPKVRLEGGFTAIEIAGLPATAVTYPFIPYITANTSPDDEGNPRGRPVPPGPPPFGLRQIDILSRGFGYNQPPTVEITHPTAEGAQAACTMRPASNGIGLEVDNIIVTEPGGGRPILDINGTVIDWEPGYENGPARITLVGGLPYDEASFEFTTPDFSELNYSALSRMSFYAVGDGNHTLISELGDAPFRWTWGNSFPGVYALYAQVVDSRGNLHASEPIYRDVVIPNLPNGEFTSPYRARALVELDSNGSISKIDITSPGASYNLPPRVFIEGDGMGASASTTIDATGTGKILTVDIDNPGSGYSYATVRFEEGLVTPDQQDEIVLGETIIMGLTAFAEEGEIQEVRLVVNDIEREEILYPTLTSDPDYGGYLFPSQEYGEFTGQGEADQNIQRLGRWKYDGTMPDYNIYWTPSDLGVYNIQALLIDHSGFSTRTSTYRVRVHNGLPPVIEMVTPRTGDSFALDYDRNQDVRLIAKAQDPDWQARFGGNEEIDRRDELSRVWFFADDQFVGVGNRILGTDHYQFVWRPTVAGTYRITAIAVDDQVGDVNNVFGDVGRVGGTGTSDPQYVSITDRGGSRPPDVFLINPVNPSLHPDFNQTTVSGESTGTPPNDDRNLQPDPEPQYLANDQSLAVEYPNLYTSGSNDMVWAWADDRDGDLDSLQFYVNGANAVVQFRQNPQSGDSITLGYLGNQKSVVFGVDVSIGTDTTETTQNLKEYLLTIATTYKMNPYLMPGAATHTEKSTVLVNFDDTSNSSLSSSASERIFTWLFTELPADPGQYPVKIGYPDAYVLDGYGGTYFGHPYVPGIDGIFSIYAVAKDNSENRVMSIPSHYKSSTGDPSGTGTLSIPIIDGKNPAINFGTTIEVIATAQSDYPIEYIEFFDNGVLFDTPLSTVDEYGTYHRGRKVEYDAPFYFAIWNASEQGEHVLYARFTDTKGNSYLSNMYKVRVQEEELNLSLSPLQLDLKNGTYGVINGAEKIIYARAEGDPGALAGLQALSLYANGVEIGRDQGVPTTLSNGAIVRIDYTFLWIANYDIYADYGGQVRLRAVGGQTRSASNEQIVTLFSPDPFDPVAVLEPMGVQMTEVERQNFDSLTNSTGNPQKAMVEYLAQTTSSSIDQNIDLVAAHKTTLGYFHDDYSRLVADRAYVNAFNDQWLKDYINDLLLSTEFLTNFGQVPFLVGSQSQRNSINFGQNRFNFVTQCFTNKYGYGPNYQQMFQGAYRMLSFWGNFEPDYWELVPGLPNVNDIDSPPRRDAIPQGAGGNANAFDNNFTYNGPEAGHCATDLIYNFSREYKFEGGFPYIAGMELYRNNIFKNVVFFHMLMQENGSLFSAAEVIAISKLPLKTALYRITNDYRYQLRYNRIMQDAVDLDSTSDWKKTSWFGTFMDKFYPWMYHVNYGWLYYKQATQNNGFWLYSDRLGWLWSSEPFIKESLVYLSNEGGWVYLISSGTSSLFDRYYSYRDGTWKEF